jgi:hypothetical protein
MNSILEYQKVIARRNNWYRDEIEKYTQWYDTHECSPLTEKIRHEQIKANKINELYDKLYRLEIIDIDECIMLKPPQLKRSDNNWNTKRVNIFDITILEHMISRLERKLTDAEKIEIYQNRLDKLEECLIHKHEKNLYKEN